MKKSKDNIRTISDLKQMQALPLDQKITMTKRRIMDWYEYWGGEVYVSFSGGKDSTENYAHQAQNVQSVCFVCLAHI